MKPRIIIVDTDINYIIHLQQKFIEEYFEEIELEVITDIDYYHKLFSSPQKADILILAEELYTSNVQIHNIKNIFLMTEQNTDNNIPNVNSIYKYTSIKKIFNVIIGKSFSAFSTSNAKKNEAKIILIYSACGGVGKTTIALGLSAVFSNDYKRVLYLNAARLQSFQTLISNVSPLSNPTAYSKLANGSDNIYFDIKSEIRNEGFNYIPSFRASLSSLNIKYSVFKNIALSARQSGDYDYIIIDADAVFDDDKTKLIDIADKVIIVTRQSKASVFATNALVSNINGANGDKYIFICNDFDTEKPNMLLSTDIANKFNVNDYVKHLSHCEELTAKDLAQEKEFQRIAVLVN